MDLRLRISHPGGRSRPHTRTHGCCNMPRPFDVPLASSGYGPPCARRRVVMPCAARRGCGGARAGRGKQGGGASGAPREEAARRKARSATQAVPASVGGIVAAATPEAIFATTTSTVLLYYACVVCAAPVWRELRLRAWLTAFVVVMAGGFVLSLAAAGFTPEGAAKFFLAQGGGNGAFGAVATFPPSLDKWVALFDGNRAAVAASWVLLMGADAVVATVIALDALSERVPCAHSIGLCLFFGPTARLCHGVTLWVTQVAKRWRSKF